MTFTLGRSTAHRKYSEVRSARSLCIDLPAGINVGDNLSGPRAFC